MVGYSPTSKNYQVWLLSTNKIIESPNVRILEGFTRQVEAPKLVTSTPDAPTSTSAVPSPLVPSSTPANQKSVVKLPVPVTHHRQVTQQRQPVLDMFDSTSSEDGYESADDQEEEILEESESSPPSTTPDVVVPATDPVTAAPPVDTPANEPPPIDDVDAVPAPRRSSRLASRLAASALIDDPMEPKSYEQALKSPQSAEWIAAMDEEMASLLGNGTWRLEAVPSGTKTLPVKWVYKIKRGADGKIQRFKARLVAKGFRQVPGIDYNEIYAPVSKHTTLRTLLALSAKDDLEIHQLDVKTAFLNGELEETIYMQQPPGYTVGGPTASPADSSSPSTDSSKLPAHGT